MEDPSRLGMDMDLKRTGRKVCVSPEQRQALIRQIAQDAQVKICFFISLYFYFLSDSVCEVSMEH